MSLPHLHLISFALCPFVQRSVITLKYKQIPHEIQYIDLADPPDWFQERSPMGKVPLLIVDREVVLFESAVINEYVDAITTPRLMPETPLDQARTRAWIEYLSDQTGIQYRWMTAATESGLEREHHHARRGLERMEQQMAQDSLLNAPEFSLIDATLAPLLLRYRLVQDDSPWEPGAFPQLEARWEWLQDLEAVRDSVPADFSTQLADYLRTQKGFAAAWVADRLS